jgi:hypothetical protein
MTRLFPPQAWPLFPGQANAWHSDISTASAFAKLKVGAQTSRAKFDQWRKAHEVKTRTALISILHTYRSVAPSLARTNATVDAETSGNCHRDRWNIWTRPVCETHTYVRRHRSASENKSKAYMLTRSIPQRENCQSYQQWQVDHPLEQVAKGWESQI